MFNDSNGRQIQVSFYGHPLTPGDLTPGDPPDDEWPGITFTIASTRAIVAGVSTGIVLTVANLAGMAHAARVGGSALPIVLHAVAGALGLISSVLWFATWRSRRKIIFMLFRSDIHSRFTATPQGWLRVRYDLKLNRHQTGTVSKTGTETGTGRFERGKGQP